MDTRQPNWKEDGAMRDQVPRKVLDPGSPGADDKTENATEEKERIFLLLGTILQKSHEESCLWNISVY